MCIRDRITWSRCCLTFYRARFHCRRTYVRFFSIAVIVHASVQLLVEINLKKWKSLMYLFFSSTITVWYGLATYFRRQWNQARLNIKQQRDHVISARARLYRERGWIACAISVSALHLVCFTWISMADIYGVCLHGCIFWIQHYNSL